MFSHPDFSNETYRCDSCRQISVGGCADNAAEHRGVTTAIVHFFMSTITNNLEAVYLKYKEIGRLREPWQRQQLDQGPESAPGRYKCRKNLHDPMSWNANIQTTLIISAPECKVPEPQELKLASNDKKIATEGDNGLQISPCHDVLTT